MHDDRPSRTAEYMALFRALESTRPAHERLFEDELAPAFLDRPLRAVVALSRAPWLGDAIRTGIDRRWPGVRSSGAGRTRLIDDALRAALAAGIEQVVLLGAGFDSRAYRIGGIERARVFELDHPATSEAKQRLLRARIGALPERVRYVALDFKRESIGSALRGAGLRADARAFFVWEGVTNYLDEAAVDTTLREVARSAPGSRILFTYIDRAVLDGSSEFFGSERVRGVLERAREPWTFGLDPAHVREFLAQRGLRLIEDLGAGDYRARYYGAAARSMRGYEFYRAALAEVASA